MKSSKENILEAVSINFNVSKQDILSQTRIAGVVRARQIYFYLCHTLTRETLSSMAKFMGGRDHATALHSINKVKSLMFIYPETRRDVKDCKKLLTEINPLIVSHIDLLQLTINYTKSFV